MMEWDKDTARKGHLQETRNRVALVRTFQWEGITRWEKVKLRLPASQVAAEC